MNRPRLPHYVDRGNEQVFRPPYVADHAGLWIILLNANRRKLDQIVQRNLTMPTKGEQSFEAAGDWVALMLADVRRLESGDPRDGPKGSVSEKELSIWLPVRNNRKRSPAWFVPYIFTDNPGSVICGREVFGYPKAYAKIHFGEEGEHADSPDPMKGFSLRTSIATEYGGQYSLQLAIQAVKDTPRPHTPMQFLDALAAIHRQPSTSGSPKLVLSAGAGPPPNVPGPLPGFSGRATRRVPPEDGQSFLMRLMSEAPLVFLKQFRDATEPTKACYQAIIESHVVTTLSHETERHAARGMSALSSLLPYSDPLTMRFIPSHDLDLADELGLDTDDTGTLSVPQILVASRPVRFDVQLGEVLWQWRH